LQIEAGARGACVAVRLRLSNIVGSISVAARFVKLEVELRVILLVLNGINVTSVHLQSDAGWKIRHRVEDSCSPKIYADPMAYHYLKMKPGVVLPRGRPGLFTENKGRCRSHKMKAMA